MHIATVEGKELTRALRALNRTPGRKLGSAFWRFSDSMVMEWSGAQRVIPAEVTSPAPDGFMISNKFMRHVRSGVSYSGPTPLSWDGQRFHIGNHRIPAQKASSSRPFSLSVAATDADLLEATLLYDSDKVREAGYGNDQKRLDERLERTLRKVAETLAWTGLARDQISPLLLDSIRDRAKRRPPPPPFELPSSAVRPSHHDLISRSGTGLVFMYVWDVLDRQGLGNHEMQRRVLLVLKELGQRGKKLKNRAFTVFAGDMWPDSSRYGIGLTTTDATLSRVLEKRLRLRSLSGPREGDLSSLYPLFRYDHGQIIVYDDASFRGRVVTDDEQWWDTGAVLHFRTYDRVSGESEYERLV